MEIRIGVARESERREAGLLHRDAELFLQFANQRIFRPLARVDLAAGEFPQPGQRLAFWALGDQHAIVGIDQGGGDDEEYFQGNGLTRRIRRRAACHLR